MTLISIESFNVNGPTYFTPIKCLVRVGALKLGSKTRDMTMDNMTDRFPENDIHDLTLMDLWSRGMPLKQIAKETGMSLDSIYRRLKAMQKIMVKKAETEGNAKKGSI